mgnify:FL=1
MSVNVKVGDILNGKVNNIKKFGAFVELPNKQVGLLHISEVSDDYVKDIRDYLKKGQHIRVKVIEVKEDDQIRLSLRQITQQDEEGKKNESFEKKLQDFLYESRLTHMELTRNIEAKRGGGKKKKRMHNRDR